jgi:nickel transport protein
MITSSSRLIGIAAAIAALVLSSAATANAHKVNIFAYADGGKVHTESYFADGTRAVGSRVSVEDMSGKLLLEGKTDKDGIFTFDIPAPEDLRIVIHASMGHKNDYVIKADELKAAMPGGGIKAPAKTAAAKPAAKIPAATKTSTTAVEKPQPPGAGTPGTAAVSAEELRTIVDETVEARLKPVYAMLSDMHEAEGKPRASEVIGGIGYIMGIMGVILYFKSRKA